MSDDLTAIRVRFIEEIPIIQGEVQYIGGIILDWKTNWEWKEIRSHFHGIFSPICWETWFRIGPWTGLIADFMQKIRNFCRRDVIAGHVATQNRDPRAVLKRIYIRPGGWMSVWQRENTVKIKLNPINIAVPRSANEAGHQYPSYRWFGTGTISGWLSSSRVINWSVEPWHSRRSETFQTIVPVLGGFVSNVRVFIKGTSSYWAKLSLGGQKPSAWFDPFGAGCTVPIDFQLNA